MADKPEEKSLFDQPDKTPEFAAQFFVDLLQGILKSPEMMRRCQAADKSGTAIEVYRRLNAPGHPVRDGLIMLGAGVLDEKKPDETKRP